MLNAKSFGCPIPFLKSYVDISYVFKVMREKLQLIFSDERQHSLTQSESSIVQIVKLALPWLAARYLCD